jgi:hypothetical protein
MSLEEAQEIFKNQLGMTGLVTLLGLCEQPPFVEKTYTDFITSNGLDSASAEEVRRAAEIYATGADLGYRVAIVTNSIVHAAESNFL